MLPPLVNRFPLVSARLAAERAGVKLLWYGSSVCAHVFNPVTMSPIGVLVCEGARRRFDLVSADPCLVGLGLAYCRELGIEVSVSRHVA